jgi:hypothetical protein
VRHFLIIAALEETWRDDRPVLLLGDWCLRFSRRGMGKNWRDHFAFLRLDECRSNINNLIQQSLAYITII